MSDFLEQVAAILDVERVTPETEFRTLPDWDSLKGFSLLILLERNYGVRMTPGEFVSCKTVSDLAQAAAPALNKK